jgi:hypothetical protein
MFPVSTDMWPLGKPCESIGAAARLSGFAVETGPNAPGPRRGMRRFAGRCEVATVCSIMPDSVDGAMIADRGNPRASPIETCATARESAGMLVRPTIKYWRLEIEAHPSAAGRN